MEIEQIEDLTPSPVIDYNETSAAFTCSDCGLNGTMDELLCGMLCPACHSEEVFNDPD